MADAPRHEAVEAVQRGLLHRVVGRERVQAGEVARRLPGSGLEAPGAVGRPVHQETAPFARDRSEVRVERRSLLQHLQRVLDPARRFALLARQLGRAEGKQGGPEQPGHASRGQRLAAETAHPVLAGRDPVHSRLVGHG